jgi:predicted phosphodiesterase
MKLFAISDLHVRYAANRQLIEALPPHPDDWLILGGDLGETEEHLQFVLRTLCPRFGQLLWVPGNHELWTVKGDANALRGEAKYLRMVELCRSFGVLTPEDPYAVWPGEGPPSVIAPLFVLYDYSFRPEHIPVERAIEWALEADILATDEMLLDPDPHASRAAWCEARCAYTEARLEALPADSTPVLINHFPLLYEQAWLPRIPRFSIWCGTRRTAEWHKRFRARVVVYGHLHMRSTEWRDGVRFEEVSLGYPRQWSVERQPSHYLREVLPGPPEPVGAGQPMRARHI